MARSAPARPLNSPGKVLKILAQISLRVPYGTCYCLPNPATGRIGVVHRDVYARAAGGNLLEAHLPGGIDLAPFETLPRDTTLWVCFGNPSVELNAFAKGPLYSPVAGIPGHADLLDVLHDVREVF